MPIFSGVTISGGGISIQPIPPPTLSYGFISGGQGNWSNIQRFPFATDTNTTNSGSLDNGKNWVAGVSSSTSGYTCGGDYFGSFPNSQIQKWPFAISVGETATVTGSLNKSATNSSAANSTEHGYLTGGADAPTGQNNTAKISFSSDGNAIAQITNSFVVGESRGGNNSETHGYFIAAPNVNIYKFPFSADVAGSSIGTVSGPGSFTAGQSSSTHGYISSGLGAYNTYSNRKAKFSFSSDASASNIGALLKERARSAGQSSETAGYTSAGPQTPADGGGYEKFLFASDNTSVSVGSLATGASDPAGHQG